MPAAALPALLPFAWSGMGAALSCLETPLKFRAPGMSRPLAAGIGRLVVKALNSIEAAAGTSTHIAHVTSEAPKVLALPVAGSLIVVGVAV
jgi:hypothetical protein